MGLVAAWVLSGFQPSRFVGYSTPRLSWRIRAIRQSGLYVDRAVWRFKWRLLQTEEAQVKSLTPH
jgi:hypothetical protein